MVLCAFRGNFGFYVEMPGLWISQENVCHVKFLLNLHRFYSNNEVDMNMGEAVKMWLQECRTPMFFHTLLKVTS